MCSSVIRLVCATQPIISARSHSRLIFRGTPPETVCTRSKAFGVNETDVDPRAKAGAYGEQVKGPHKPTLDEMGPHAERGLPVAGRPRPPKPPTKTIDIPDDREKKKHRHGRPRKTGRPGA